MSLELAKGRAGLAIVEGRRGRAVIVRMCAGVSQNTGEGMTYKAAGGGAGDAVGQQEEDNTKVWQELSWSTSSEGQSAGMHVLL